ncbi:MAG TPA: type II toxin-antitoxin system death-on-curing family toxin [Candidatus Acidoferrum sp.]|nr:type II toxin-antitoxin system death-on-curing family toxin [Candidatus Acidoferrum sp.]
MKEPYWLTREECLALHEMMLAQYGGTEGLRDENMLESALAKPRQLFAYGKPSLADLAASYVFGVVKNHPFIDGNKRTGFMLGAGFLERNGHEFHASEADAVVRTLALAAGEMSEAEYAAWLKANSRRAKG